MELILSLDHVGAVNLLCTSEEHVKVSLKDEEMRRGILSADSMRR